MINISNYLTNDIDNFSIRTNIINIYTMIYSKTMLKCSEKYMFLDFLPKYGYFRHGYVLHWDYEDFEIIVYYYFDGKIEKIFINEGGASIKKYKHHYKLISDVLKLIIY